MLNASQTSDTCGVITDAVVHWCCVLFVICFIVGSEQMSEEMNVAM